jgi:hypothetical protein
MINRLNGTIAARRVQSLTRKGCNQLGGGEACGPRFRFTSREEHSPNAFPRPLWMNKERSNPRWI